MKKKTFNKKSLPKQREVGSFIRVMPKNGGFALSVNLSHRISTSRIQLVQDEDKPTDWYLEPTSDENAYELRTIIGGKKLFQSAALVRHLLTELKLEHKSTLFIVATEPVDGLFPIITKSAKQ